MDLTVTARQAGNENYHAADEVLRTLHVVGDALGQDTNDFVSAVFFCLRAAVFSLDGVNGKEVDKNLFH